MAKIKDENQYKAALHRIDELLKVCNDDTPTTDKNYIELDMISDLVEEYEDEHYPIPVRADLQSARQEYKDLQSEQHGKSGELSIN